MNLDVPTSLGSNAACMQEQAPLGPPPSWGHSTRPLAGSRRSGREPILAISQPHSDLDTAMPSQKSTWGRQESAGGDAKAGHPPDRCMRIKPKRCMEMFPEAG